jgi:cytochrome c-type biogenesis protein CcmE
MSRTRVALGVAAVLAFLVFGLLSFRSSLTPYVSFAEARRAGRQVQIAGKLEPNSARYEEQTHSLRFRLREEGGDILETTYSGTKPVNFEDAISIVAIGAYSGGVFRSSRLLVKCPSKYEGVGAEREYTSTGKDD